MLETGTDSLRSFERRQNIIALGTGMREMYFDIPWGREYCNYKFPLFFCDRLTFHRSYYCCCVRFLCSDDSIFYRFLLYMHNFNRFCILIIKNHFCRSPFSQNFTTYRFVLKFNDIAILI